MGYTSSGNGGVNITTQGRYQVARVQVTEQCSSIVGFTAPTYFGHFQGAQTSYTCRPTAYVLQIVILKR
jgi:hypothetical protein